MELGKLAAGNAAKQSNTHFFCSAKARSVCTALLSYILQPKQRPLVGTQCSSLPSPWLPDSPAPVGVPFESISPAHGAPAPSSRHLAGLRSVQAILRTLWLEALNPVARRDGVPGSRRRSHTGRGRKTGAPREFGTHNGVLKRGEPP